MKVSRSLTTSLSSVAARREPARALRRAAFDHFGRALQQQPRLARRECTAQQEPLRMGALMFLQEAELRKGLDTFGDDIDLERLRHGDDRGGDGAIVAVVTEIEDEGAVPLEAVGS